MPKVVPGYKEAARSKIVMAGFKIFSTRGYSESTMDDVAAKGGKQGGNIPLLSREGGPPSSHLRVESGEAEGDSSVGVSRKGFRFGA